MPLNSCADKLILPCYIIQYTSYVITYLENITHVYNILSETYTRRHALLNLFMLRPIYHSDYRIFEVKHIGSMTSH